MAPGDTHMVSGAMPSQPPIIMFMPNQPAPVYSLAQNDGTLAISYNPTCIRRSPPPSNLDMRRLRVPAKCVPPPYADSLAETRRCSAAKLQIPGPSEDDKLLARLTGRGVAAARPKRERAEESRRERLVSHKYWVYVEKMLTDNHSKVPAKKKQRRVMRAETSLIEVYGQEGKKLHSHSERGSRSVICTVKKIAAPENLPVPAFVHCVSDDCRRVYTEELEVDPPSLVKRFRPQPPKPVGIPLEDLAAFDVEGFSMNSERYELGLNLDDTEAVPSARPKGGTVKPSDPSLSQWRVKRDTYLAALLRRDGTGKDSRSETSLCPTCRTRVTEFRCRDCFGDIMYCKACTLSAHSENPLHRIEKWHYSYFVRTSLAQLGLRVQLGHRPHQRCSAPEPAHSGFITLHTNGIHKVRIDFWGCERAEEVGGPEIQLLRAGWFPATHEWPQTCATITVLEQFHQDTLQSKMTMYDFYGVLEKLTDNTGIKPPDQYHEWICMCREFRHLMLLKQGGRAMAYSGSGVDGTQPGELAVECPACPRPDVNLPAGWENASPNEQFLYTLFLALDACFRLKRRLVSSELKDPDLGPDWAYMVETGPYREYLQGVTKQREMNTCSGLAALDYANTKFSRGYSMTGMGMAVCGRHEFVQPNGVGDLQKGERFSNMDYIFALILGSAQGDAEGIERVWAWIGAVAASMRDMGPGLRHDILDCQWGYWNWQKLIGIEEELKEQTEAFEEFSAQPADRVPVWQQKVLDYEAEIEAQAQKDDEEGRNQEKLKTKNPYEIKIEGARLFHSNTRLATNWIPSLSEAQVRLQFTKEEAAEAARSCPCTTRQLRLQAELKKAGTTGMEIDLASMRTKLNCGIARFRKIQGAYMPPAIQALGDLALPSTTLAEDIPLLLPSALTEAQRARCAQGLKHIEALMRDAQCRTGLSRLRCQLHVKSGLFVYKKNHVRHQGANTRVRMIVTRNESKIRLHSEKYQVAWDALRQLNGEDEEMIGWKALKKEDIRSREAQQRKKNLELRAHGLLPAEEDENMEVDEEPGVRGPENQRQLSWIWVVVAGTDRTDAGLENALRVEWSKAFARVWCWDEEVRLLLEEFHCVCLSFEHEERRWRARAAAVPVGMLPLPDAEAAVAYALRHADMFVDLRERGMKRWNEKKLARGKKRARHVPAVMGAMEAEARAEHAETAGSALWSVGHGREADDEDEEDCGACGDVENDKQFILGGKGEEVTQEFERAAVKAERAREDRQSRAGKLRGRVVELTEPVMYGGKLRRGVQGENAGKARVMGRIEADVMVIAPRPLAATQARSIGSGDERA
ncbi:hypothetical protein K438DRAFT_1775752 [Mycena galopus ATCC 62051]|nr:hypothetical protein K438DRAFT_1775752 [Mycena galopus ATCC 62051]